MTPKRRQQIGSAESRRNVTLTRRSGYVWIPQYSREQHLDAMCRQNDVGQQCVTPEARAYSDVVVSIWPRRTKANALRENARIPCYTPSNPSVRTFFSCKPPMSTTESQLEQQVPPPLFRTHCSGSNSLPRYRARNRGLQQLPANRVWECW
jgi:hypothetical protein